jgi:predicted adenylyl cyclase CyaB
MIELELKARIDDPAACRARLAAAGARIVVEGRMVDRRYDLPGDALARRDEVLRTRSVTHADGRVEGSVDWKGPTRAVDGYKAREERTASADVDAVCVILERLGYVRVREVEREVTVYALDGATVRFERYPRMDTLAEVEGTPDAMERAIAALGVPRGAFTAARLSTFVSEYEARTGHRAALSSRELEEEARDV